jgi:hypothetical protein
MIPAAIGLLIGLGFGLETGHNSRQGGGHLYSYCIYGAVSRAQLHGCLDHVKDRSIDGRETNAARFANGSLHRCLGDAGPFCEQALYWSDAADAAGPP